MVELDTSIDALINSWLDRLEDEGVDPVLEARALVDQAPRALRPMLQAELGGLMQMAQATVQGARLKEGGQLGEYRLLKLLGAGSTGSVWEAQDPAGERLALKVLHPVFLASEDGVETLRNELRQREGLGVPHLVPAHGSVEDGGVVAVRFSLIGQGQTLAHHIAEARDGEAVHEPRKVLLGIMPALRALAALHAREVSHGDVKPGNLILDDRGQCHLSDLGLAQPFRQVCLQLHGQVMGTPAYLAPELLSAQTAARTLPTVRPQADVWSAGVLLQEALTLHRPFEATSPEGLAEAISGSAPRVARLPRGSASREFERGLRSILARCMEPSPGARYPDAGALVEDLDRLLADEPVVGSPLSTLVRNGYARHRRSIGVVTIAVLTGLAGTGLAQHYRGLSQRILAEEAGTENANALLNRALSSLRRDALDREGAVQGLMGEMASLVPQDAPGDPLVRASILSQFAFLVSETPLPNREALPAIDELSEGALALLPEEHFCARAEVWIQRAMLATRSWRYDLAEASWASACAELEHGIPHETDPERRSFEELRLSWARAMWAVSQLEQAAVYSADTRVPTEEILAGLERGAASARSLGDEPWALRCELAANLLIWHSGGVSPQLAWEAHGLVESLTRELGALHPWTLDAKYNAAFLAHRVPEQVGLDQMAAFLADPSFPEGAPRTREGYAEWALEQFVELEDQATLAYGPRHLVTALATLGRGQQLMLTGDPESGVGFYEAALETLERVMQPSSEKLRRVSTGYGICLQKAGQLTRSREVLEEQVRLCEEHLPTRAANWTAIIARRALTSTLQQLGLGEDVLRVQREQWEAAQPRLTELRSTLLWDVRWSAWYLRLWGITAARVEEIKARLETIEATAADAPFLDREEIDFARWAVAELEAVLHADEAELARVNAAERLRRDIENSVDPGFLERTLISRGSVAEALGDVPMASALLEEAREAGRDTPHLIADLECCRALAALKAGDPGPARALLAAFEARREAPDARTWIVPQIGRLERALED